MGNRNKMIICIFIIIIAIFGINFTIDLSDQAGLDRNNTPIQIMEVSDEYTLNYTEHSKVLIGKISGISKFVKLKVAEQDVAVQNLRNHIGEFKYELKDIAEGESTTNISVTDGKRSTTKAVGLNRQTKESYDKEKLEEAISRVEKSLDEAESNPLDENITKIEQSLSSLPDELKGKYQDRLNSVKNTLKSASASNAVTKTSMYSVANVIDGDTIDLVINGKTERIRMIGLDTPETKDPRKPVQCFGQEASQRMRELVNGKNVYIEQDPTQGERDKYGRLLLYIFLDDRTNVAYKMIYDGYGHEYTYNTPHKYQNQFKNAQKDAENNKRGLWAENTCAGDINKSAVKESPQSSAHPAPAPSYTAPKSAAPVYVAPKPAAPVYVAPNAGMTCPANCTQARQWGMAGMRAGHPCYSLKLDRDRDGIACE